MHFDTVAASTSCAMEGEIDDVVGCGVDPIVSSSSSLMTTLPMPILFSLLSLLWLKVLDEV